MFAVDSCKPKFPKGAIIGIAVGGGLLLIAVAVGVALVLNKEWALNLVHGKSLQGNRRPSTSMKVGRNDSLHKL